MKTRKSFNINGEMLGKASRFVSQNKSDHPELIFLRIEKSKLFGAKIIACDGHRLIIFTDPASDFQGPDFNLGVYMHSRNPAYSPSLRPFIKACRKLKSQVRYKRGYVTIDPTRKEAGINGQVFKIICNSKEYFDYKSVGKVKRIVNRKNVGAINPKYFVDSRHAILSEEDFGSVHFINVSHENQRPSALANFLLITRYSIFITMPVARSRRNHSQLDTDSKILASNKSLLDKVNLMLSLEDENAFTAAYKNKQFPTEFGNIFFDIK